MPLPYFATRCHPTSWHSMLLAKSVRQGRGSSGGVLAAIAYSPLRCAREEAASRPGSCHLRRSRLMLPGREANAGAPVRTEI